MRYAAQPCAPELSQFLPAGGPLAVFRDSPRQGARMSITVDGARSAWLRQFRADVLRGLHSRPKYLPCKYFYDEAGSALFEQITLLPEYYLTRTELAIMHQHAADMARWLGPRCLLIEYGSGSSTKTRLLLDRMDDPAGYVP